MSMDEDIRTIVKEALWSLDKPRLHGAGDVKELRSRVNILVELVRDVFEKNEVLRAIAEDRYHDDDTSPDTNEETD